MFVGNLTINEFALSQGFSIVGVVYGSIVHTDVEEDFPATSQAMKAATRRQSRVLATAIARLQEKASQRGASGVIGVQILHRPLENNLWEYTLAGTAIADDTPKGMGQPFLCTLSGQEYMLLYAGGYRPVGLAYGVSVYAQRLHQRVQQKVQQQVNTERSDFTRGLYAARKYAFAALDQEAVKLKSEGVLAVKITIERALHRESGVSQGMLIKFNAFGTAVVACPSTDLAITPVMLTNA